MFDYCAVASSYYMYVSKFYASFASHWQRTIRELMSILRPRVTCYTNLSTVWSIRKLLKQSMVCKKPCKNRQIIHKVDFFFLFDHELVPLALKSSSKFDIDK